MDDRLGAVADHVTFTAAGEIFGSQREWNPHAYAYRTLVGLHVARFGGPPLRGMYFLCGLAGTLALACGLVLFALRHRPAPGEAAGRPAALMEALSIAAATGSAIACAAFLAAGRGLPTGLAARPEWETGIFLAAWGLSLVHALLRPPVAAWREQLAAAAALCLALPALDGLAGGFPAAAGPSAARFGFDLVATLLGAGLAAGAALLFRRQHGSAQ